MRPRIGNDCFQLITELFRSVTEIFHCPHSERQTSPTVFCSIPLIVIPESHLYLRGKAKELYLMRTSSTAAGQHPEPVDF